MSDHFYDPVGACIYCGTTTVPDGESRFGDEHIIPFAFGGTLILRQASCPKCARTINREIETPILDREWGAFRAKRGFPTRNPKRRKQTLATPISLPAKEGSDLPISLMDHSTPVPLYIFGTPRILTGLPRDAIGQTWSVQMLSAHQDEVDMQRKFPRWNKTHTIKIRAITFARLLAKIAYGYAVAEYGLSTTTAFTPLGLDLILGRSDDGFYTVGGDSIIPPQEGAGPPHTLGLLLLSVSLSRLLLVVEIRLFRQSSTPVYRVIVGEILLNNPEHVAMYKKHRAHGKIKEFPL